MWRVTYGPKTRIRTEATGVIQMGNDGGIDLKHGTDDEKTELRNTGRINRTWKKVSYIKKKVNSIFFSHFFSALLNIYYHIFPTLS